VKQIIPDPAADGMYLALIEPSSYLDFVKPVPFSDADGVVERGILNDQGRISGQAQSAVRPIAPSDFERIVARGLDDNAGLLPRTDERILPQFDEGQTPYQFEEARERLNYLSYGSYVIEHSADSSWTPTANVAPLLA
jgi:putative restriction endonuclease